MSHVCATRCRKKCSRALRKRPTPMLRVDSLDEEEEDGNEVAISESQALDMAGTTALMGS